jgi:acetylornithine deacetylase/succinyl-diaminopimelate desuccinylase-like protein
VRISPLVFLLLFSTSSFAQQHYLVDWEAAGEEALNHLSELVQIDSTNPPGNESRVADYVAAVLASEGIDSNFYALEADRASLVARITGNGSKPPILIMGHTDVVGVQVERWEEDPFGGLRKNGWVYGRGTLDDKDNVTAGLMVMLLLKRIGVELERDVIFLAEAGEEGTPQVGITYLVENHWEAIEAEYCLAEGGGGIADDDHVEVVGIQTTEKLIRRATLVARGTAGHGSTPRPDNAIVILSRAVARAAEWQTEVRLTDTTRAYFQRLAAISEPEDAFRYEHVADPRESPAIQQYFLENMPYHNSVLRTSVVPTIIEGGFRRNVVPSEARAMLDIRMLPDEDVEAFYARLAKVIDDPRVDIVPEAPYRPVAPASPIDNEMFQTLERVAKQVYPGAAVLPQMSTAGTDMSQVRAMGVPCYGVGPIRSVAELNSGNGAHSDNERVAEQAMVDFVRFLWLTIIDIAAAKS